MIKRKLTLSIDDELIKFAKDADMNISQFLEDKLMEYFKVRRVDSLWVKYGN